MVEFKYRLWTTHRVKEPTDSFKVTRMVESMRPRVALERSALLPHRVTPAVVRNEGQHLLHSFLELNQ